MPGLRWTTSGAIALCRRVEALCPAFGCHVALTGGALYGEPESLRKDVDLVFYRIRSVPTIDVDGLFAALASIGIERVTEGDRWCIKATHTGDPVDCFFPEFEGDYPPAASSLDEPLEPAPGEAVS